MASNKMDEGKRHGGGEVKGALRHNDISPERRKVAARGNEHIDVSKSHLNVNLTGDTYEERCQKYDARIAALDAVPGANKRKDRVTGQLIETPVPAGLPRDKYNAFLGRVLDIQKEMFGAENLISADIHWDEEHEYIDSETSQKRMSRVHLQTIFVPVGTVMVDGVSVERLQYKAIYSKGNLNKLNNACQKMAMDEFGVDFMDGSGKSSKKSVRKLKEESRAKAEAAEIISKAEAESSVIFNTSKSNADDYYSDTIDEARKEAEKQAAEIIERAERQAAQIVKDAGHEARRMKTAALGERIKATEAAQKDIDASATKAQGAVDLLKIELAQVRKEIADKVQELGDMDDYPEYRRRRAEERAQEAQEAARREQEAQEARAAQEAARKPQEAPQVPPAVKLAQDAEEMAQEAQEVSVAGSSRRMLTAFARRQKDTPSGSTAVEGPTM